MGYRSARACGCAAAAVDEWSSTPHRKPCRAVDEHVRFHRTCSGGNPFEATGGYGSFRDDCLGREESVEFTAPSLTLEGPVSKVQRPVDTADLECPGVGAGGGQASGHHPQRSGSGRTGHRRAADGRRCRRRLEKQVHPSAMFSGPRGRPSPRRSRSRHCLGFAVCALRRRKSATGVQGVCCRGQMRRSRRPSHSGSSPHRPQRPCRVAGPRRGAKAGGPGITTRSRCAPTRRCLRRAPAPPPAHGRASAPREVRRTAPVRPARFGFWKPEREPKLRDHLRRGFETA